MSEIFEEVLGPTAKLETSPPFLLISANSSHPQRVPIPGTPTLWNRSHCPPPCWTCWLPVHAVLCGANPTHPFWAPQWLSSFLLRGRFQPLLISCVVFHSSHWWKARNLRGRSKTQPQRSSRVSRPCGTHAHSCRHSLEGNLAFNDLALYL